MNTTSGPNSRPDQTVAARRARRISFGEAILGSLIVLGDNVWHVLPNSVFLLWAKRSYAADLISGTPDLLRLIALIMNGIVVKPPMTVSATPAPFDASLLSPREINRPMPIPRATRVAAKRPISGIVNSRLGISPPLTSSKLRIRVSALDAHFSRRVADFKEAVLRIGPCYFFG
jgi:hypothetical protein